MKNKFALSAVITGIRNTCEKTSKDVKEIYQQKCFLNKKLYALVVQRNESCHKYHLEKNLLKLKEKVMYRDEII